MARKRNQNNHDIFPGDDDELMPSHDANESDGGADGLDDMDGISGVEDVDTASDNELEQAVLPTASDLESRGFTPEEVRRLVVVSDRQSQSDESQIAEATLRRLRFTRWLIEHGMLDEWSA